VLIAASFNSQLPEQQFGCLACVRFDMHQSSVASLGHAHLDSLEVRMKLALQLICINDPLQMR
jgi:hypothetical protein